MAAETERVDIEQYNRALVAAGKSAGFVLDVYGVVENCPLPCLIREAEGSPLWYLSSGIHGDEPAGPLAILRALEQNRFPASVGWVVFPLLNPFGITRGLRENRIGVDLNRDYRDPTQDETHLHIAALRKGAWQFEGSLSLHEDWEAKGAYVYEHNPNKKPSPLHNIMQRLTDICGLDPHDCIDGWDVTETGIIHPPSDPRKRSYWPEQVYLLDQHTDMSYTVETPSAHPLQERIQAHMECIEAIAVRRSPPPVEVQ